MLKLVNMLAATWSAMTIWTDTARGQMTRTTVRCGIRRALRLTGFHIASAIHQVLRYGMLFHEVRNKMGRQIDVSMGDVIPPERLQKIGDLRAATDFLRATTHALARVESVRS